MPQTVRFLPPADLHDIIRGMAVVCKLYDPDPDTKFRLDPALAAGYGSWQDVAGNRAHFVFAPEGSVILGYDHESPMSPHATAAESGDFATFPGVYDSLPAALLERVEGAPFGPDFDRREVTFCLWNTGTGKDWQKGDVTYPPRDKGDPDGEGYVLGKVKGFYDDFAGAFEETYHWDLDPDAVTDLLSGDRISLAVVRGLKPDANSAEARRWLPEMGFVLDASGR